MRDRTSWPEVTTLVFDVMGTVVDVDATVRSTAISALASAGVDDTLVRAFVEDWTARLQRLLDDVIAGELPWRGHQDLRRAALEEAVVVAGIGPLPPDTTETLASVIHRCRPWPESAAALARLRATHTVVALSNADFAELVDLSRLGAFAWHGVISTASSHSFKPDPAVYRNAVLMLGVEPAAIMMVAAHPWDLRAAAEHGLATAYVARPGSQPPRADDHFDMEVSDLDGLADRLAP